MSTARSVHKGLVAPGRGVRVLIAGLTCSVVAALASCAGESAGLSPSGKFVVGYQQGLGSAPLILVETNGCMKDAVEGVTVEFKQFNSGAAIRDSMLSDTVQAGGVGLAPFLIGADKGVDWKILAAQNNMEFRLMTKDSKLRSLADFEKDDQIAVPAPDSIQAVVLRKAAEQELGDPNALEKNLVSMGHPDALQALMSGQIAGHVASAPFTYKEEQKGAHRVFGSGEVFDKPINNTLVAVRQGVQEAQPEVTKALKSCVGKAIDTLNNDPNQAAELLEKAYQGKQSADSIKAELAEKDLVWPAQADGVELVASFMREIGVIEEVPSLADVTEF